MFSSYSNKNHLIIKYTNIYIDSLILLCRLGSIFAKKGVFFCLFAVFFGLRMAVG